MGVSDWRAILIKSSRCGRVWPALLCLLLSGCGLLIDAVEQVWPVAGSKVDIICERGRVQVGLAREDRGGDAADAHAEPGGAPPGTGPDGRFSPGDRRATGLDARRKVSCRRIRRSLPAR